MRGWRCSAFNCVKKKTRDARLFRFPANAVQRQCWVENCREENWTPSDNSRLCEAHFEENQFELHRADGKKKLRWNAIPTLFSHTRLPKHHTLAKKRNVINKEKLVQTIPPYTDHQYGAKPYDNINLSEVVSWIKTEKEPVSFNSHPSNTFTAGSDGDAHIFWSCENEDMSESQMNAGSKSQTVTSNAVSESSREIELRLKVKRLQRQLRCEKEKVVQFEQSLNRLFNEDQLQFLKGNCTSTRAVKWSNETIRSSLKILCATGIKGYTYLLKARYPLPSYRTLCSRVDDGQHQPGIHHDIFTYWNVNMDSLNSMNMECILSIDELPLEPTLQYNKGAEYTEEDIAEVSPEIRDEMNTSEEIGDDMKTSASNRSPSKPIGTHIEADECNAAVSDTISNSEHKQKKRSSNVARKSVAFVEHSYHNTRLEALINRIAQCNNEENENGGGLNQNEYSCKLEQSTQAHSPQVVPVAEDISEVIPRTTTVVPRPRRRIKGVQPPTSFSCKICGLIILTKPRLAVHLRTHTLERPYKCEVCAKSFATSSNLNCHAMIHTGVRPHLCDLCGKGFLQKAQLKEHVLSHGEEKTHACEQCGRLFKRIAALRIHMKYAHDEGDGTTTGHRKKFPCEICSRSFASAAWLRFHGKLHRGEKPFECATCKKCFVQKQQLDQHMRVHSGERPFVCGICFKSFIFKNALERHVLIHSGEKPFKCTVCGKEYCQSSNLRTHMQTHSGERPYRCGECEKSFTNRRDMRLHCERMHMSALE